MKDILGLLAIGIMVATIFLSIGGCISVMRGNPIIVIKHLN